METQEIGFKRYEDQLGFYCAFDLGNKMNLAKIAEQLPKSVVLCTSKIIAGIEHVSAILDQTSESSKRGINLARNKSIELLMRITCQSQITEAITTSGITDINELAIFGFVGNESIFSDALHIIASNGIQLFRNDKLLSLTKEKAMRLKQLHSLPIGLSRDELLVSLKEKSALLVFDR